MKGFFLSFFSGGLFAFGLVISGMNNPDKVKGFLDILGSWDYSLALVMLGAIGFNFFSFKLINKSKPLFAESHCLPTNNSIDRKLILGAIIFGTGWGLIGICPGPALVNLVTLNSNAIIFVVAMVIGMGVFRLLEKLKII